jgi:hypothetical protein
MTAVIIHAEMYARERINWLTTTRSVPLMMNVAFSVINGNHPRKISCWTFRWSRFTRATSTTTGYSIGQIPVETFLLAVLGFTKAIS